MNMNNKATGVFPIPVYMTKRESAPSLKEQADIEEILKERQNTNVGNFNSSDQYILNSRLKEIKQFCEQQIKIYAEEVINPKEDLDFYITQSWLNYTNKNEYHHTHNHPNSLVSGIIYMNADIATDSIKFYRHRQDAIVIPSPNNYNPFNSDFWWFAVKTGQIMLFPSSLHHSVAAKQGNNTRVSLSFNVFFIRLFYFNTDIGSSLV